MKTKIENEYNFIPSNWKPIIDSKGIYEHSIVWETVCLLFWTLVTWFLCSVILILLLYFLIEVLLNFN